MENVPLLIYGAVFLAVLWPLSRWIILMRRTSAALRIFGNDVDDFSTFPDGVVEEAMSYPHPGGGEEPYRKVSPGGSTSRAAVIIFHGASPFGEHHPAINKLAYALSSIGLTVYIPRLPRLMALRFEDATSDAIAACYRHIVATGNYVSGQVSLIGTSFAGGLMLKAESADSWGTIRPGQIMTFGTYFSMESTLRFALTGIAEYGRERVEVTPDPWSQIIFFHNFLDNLDRQFDRPLLRSALDLYIAGRQEDGKRAMAGLPDRERQLLETMVAPSSSAALALAEEIMPHARSRMQALSPDSFASRLKGRIWILHGRQDISVPYTEALALKDKLGRQGILNIAGHFGHKTTERGPSFWQQLRHVVGMHLYLSRFLKAVGT